MTVQRYDDGMSMFGFIDKEINGRFVLHRDYVVAVRAMVWWRNRCRSYNERRETLRRACAGHLEQAKRATKAEAKLAAAEDQLATIHGLAFDAQVDNCGKDYALEYIRNVAFGDTTLPHPGRDWRKRAEAAEEALRQIYNGLVEINPNNHDEDDVFTQNNSVIESIHIADAILAGHAPATKGEGDEGAHI